MPLSLRYNLIYFQFLPVGSDSKQVNWVSPKFMRQDWERYLETGWICLARRSTLSGIAVVAMATLRDAWKKSLMSREE